MSNTSKDNIEFVRWQSENHKLERNIYLGLSTLLSSFLIYVVTQHTAYVNRQLDQQKQDE